MESPHLPVQNLQSQLPSSLAFEGIQMEDFTSGGAVAVKMQGSATSLDPPPEAEESRSASVFVEIENLEKTWRDSMKKKVDVEPKRLKTSSTKDSCSIHRVPRRLHHHDEKLRVPRIISIGPFHYDKRKDQLQAMEEHKWRYLRDILARNGGDDCLDQCLTAIKEVENEARECYSEEVELDSNSFVEMLVLDACFIIELFRREWFGLHQGNDPILDLGWLQSDLVIDLMMLENQIPFFILELLSNLMNVSEPSPVEGALHFFCLWSSFEELGLDTRISHPKPKIHHLLHLLHTKVVLTERIELLSNSGSYQKIPSASQLIESGVTFKKRNGAHKFLDIKFQNGVIEIPPFTIMNRTYPIFFNLVAFEHSYRHCRGDITAYACFMDDLINTATDVEILCQKIISNQLGTNQEVADLFNNIGREALIPNDFYLSNVDIEINQYYGKFYPRMRATLKHDYCRTPCQIISIFAAIFLLLLTLGQFFFSAFPKFALQKNGN